LLWLGFGVRDDDRIWEILALESGLRSEYLYVVKRAAAIRVALSRLEGANTLILLLIYLGYCFGTNISYPFFKTSLSLFSIIIKLCTMN